MLKQLRGLLSHDLAVDLGTANSLIFVRGKGIVLNEPSVIAVRLGQANDPRSVAAVGSAARRMLGRAPGAISVTRPLRDGVVANFTLTQAMLKHFIREVHEVRAIRPSPRVLIGIPGGATQVERRAIRESAAGAGVRTVSLIQEPLAAAIGAGIAVEEPRGSMVLDIGGGTSEIAVISLGGIVHSEAIRAGGDRMDDAIASYVRRQYGTVIGETTAERIKHEVGSAYPGARSDETEVRGGDLSAGLPHKFTITSAEILEPLTEPLDAIVQMTRRAMERTPPELASDIAERGMVIAGGGALLPGLDRLIAEELDVPVVTAEDPLTCVARGAGRALELMDRTGHDFFIEE